MLTTEQNDSPLSGVGTFLELCKGLMVRPEGLEPPTLWFEAKCSIQLSYRRAKQGTRNYTSILKITNKTNSGN